VVNQTTEPNAALHTPFAGLTPAVILDALDSVGLQGDGRLLQLNSYENRVFQVFLTDDRAVVAKFYRPQRWSDEQILEEHTFSAELAAEEIPLAAPLLLAADTTSPMQPILSGTPPTLAQVSVNGAAYRFAVADRKAGRAPELEHPATLEWIGRFIGRMHVVGARKPFVFRRSLTMHEFGWDCRDWLLANAHIPSDIAPAWNRAVDAALTTAQRRFERVGAIDSIRLHGDCHTGNVLWTDAGPHFVDLDDCLTGPAVQDLWMLLSGDPQAAKQQLRSLLSGYEQFMEFDDRQLALIEPLRTLRIVHQSAWLAKRWSDPAFPPSFPWFASGAYWQQLTQQLEQQAEACS
jgi:Ser/Thr protein kinase RdoA (MazF antagonist)